MHFRHKRMLETIVIMLHVITTAIYLNDSR